MHEMTQQSSVGKSLALGLNGSGVILVSSTE